MIVKYIFPFLILMTLLSCSLKNFEKKLVMKPVPATINIATNEANVLRDYADKLKQIDLDKDLSRIKNETEKERFKFRIAEFKVIYNKCVDKLVEIETQKPKDLSAKMRQLKEDMLELDAIWKYIIVNYKI